MLAFGCYAANDLAIPLDNLAKQDRNSLMETFKNSPTIEVEVNLSFIEIGSDKEHLLKRVTAKPLPNFEGFTFSVPNKQQYLSQRSNILSTQPICKIGLVSAGKAVYKIFEISSLELIHSCGTNGCGYEFNYHTLPAEEVCKVVMK